MELKALQEKFNRLVTEAETIRQKYAGTDQTMTAEELARWEALLDEADQVKAQIENLEREQKLRAWANEPASTIPLATATKAVEHPVEDKTGDVAAKAFVKWLSGGPLTETELKALSVDPHTAGGYLVVPQQLVNRLVTRLNDQVYIRQWATIVPLARAESLGVPVLDADVSSPEWTTELTTGSEDAAMTFGKRQLFPHLLSKRVVISQRLLRQAAQDPEQIVMDRLAYQFAIAEENAYLNGDGNNKPLGVFTPSPQGIDTNRDVTASTAGTIAADDLIEVRYSLKESYVRNARWVLHRDVLKRIRKLKDSTGQYLWSPGIAGSQPATILDIPYVVSEFAPNDVSAGKYVAILGDFSFYWIAESLELQVQRLTELYAERNMVGFIARREVDGMPVLGEAFVRYKV